jgi:hypothetical protein
MAWSNSSSNRSAARKLRSAYQRSASAYSTSTGDAMTTSTIESGLPASSSADFVPRRYRNLASVNGVAAAICFSEPSIRWLRPGFGRGDVPECVDELDSLCRGESLRSGEDVLESGHNVACGMDGGCAGQNQGRDSALVIVRTSVRRCKNDGGWQETVEKTGLRRRNVGALQD